MEAQKQTREAIRDAIQKLLGYDRGGVAVLAEELDFREQQHIKFAEANQVLHADLETAIAQRDEYQGKLVEVTQRCLNLENARTIAEQSLRRAEAARTPVCDPEPDYPSCKTCGVPLTPDHRLASGHTEAL